MNISPLFIYLFVFNPVVLSMMHISGFGARKRMFLSFFFFLAVPSWLLGSWFLNQGLNPRPLSLRGLAG